MGGAATERWRDVIGQWRRSGLSQSAFCRQRGVALPTLNYWKRRLENGAGGAAFVPVRVTATPPFRGAANDRELRVRVKLLNGRVLSFPAHISPEELARLASALERAPC